MRPTLLYYKSPKETSGNYAYPSVCSLSLIGREIIYLLLVLNVKDFHKQSNPFPKIKGSIYINIGKELQGL